MDNMRAWANVAIIALVTALTRFLPFILFRHGKIPKIVEKLGRNLPYAIMGMLVVYCLKGVGFASASDFLPEAVACLTVGISFVLKRNTLISIILGTACYMVLVHTVF